MRHHSWNSLCRRLKRRCEKALAGFKPVITSIIDYSKGPWLLPPVSFTIKTPRRALHLPSTAEKDARSQRTRLLQDASQRLPKAREVDDHVLDDDHSRGSPATSTLRPSLAAHRDRLSRGTSASLQADGRSSSSGSAVGLASLTGRRRISQVDVRQLRQFKLVVVIVCRPPQRATALTLVFMKQGVYELLYCANSVCLPFSVIC
jgi:hypothetical protein